MIARLFSVLRRGWWRLRSLRIRTVLRLAYPGVRCHPSVRFGRGVTIRAFDGARIDIGRNVGILEYAQVQADRGGHLILGEQCLIGRGAVVICGQSIEIGAGTMTAEHVTIRDQDHNHEGDGRLETQGSTTAAIKIGHDVWLGAKVTVTKGVEIAPHSVVGANAVVTRSLPERGIYAGAPARLLRRVTGSAVERSEQTG
jgi:acetyltransferase-like isoleucine patch superfamily enzyme